jgi:hypothetical protein
MEVSRHGTGARAVKTNGDIAQAIGDENVTPRRARFLYNALIAPAAMPHVRARMPGAERSMREVKTRHQIMAALCAAVFTVLIMWTATPHAQRPQGAGNATPAAPAGAPGGGQRGGGQGGGGGQPAAPAAKPLMPVAASSIAMRPDAYYGQNVTIYGTVDQSLATLVFSMDQDKNKPADKPVIVISPRLHEPVELNAYVTVMGEVVRPDAAEIARRMKGAANGVAEILAKYPGRPVVLATSVINGALTDLAKFIPPPLTPEEAELDKHMKAVGGANGALRKGVDASNVELVKTNTAILGAAFAYTETFWKKRGKDDAVKIAQTARGAVDGIEKALAAGNWNDVKTHNTTLGQQCAACHGVYRERGEDGSFYIKPGESR